MRRAATLILVIILGLVEQVFAADLTKIDRTILKLPPLRYGASRILLACLWPRRPQARVAGARWRRAVRRS